MTKKDRDQLAKIKYNASIGMSDPQQAKALGLSLQGFFQRVWSLEKQAIREELNANFTE